MRWILLLLMVCTGCQNQTPDVRDAVSCDLAVAMFTQEVVPVPAPDTGALPTGPLDIVRDAKSLIEKGNVLADRGKQILDAAQRDGKVTVDVRLPKPDPQYTIHQGWWFELVDGKYKAIKPVAGSWKQVNGTWEEVKPACSTGACPTGG
jgi:hypothetical protein